MAWWIYLLGMVLLVALWNLLFRYLTYRSVDKYLQKVSWKNESLDKYIFIFLISAIKYFYFFNKRNSIFLFF